VNRPKGTLALQGGEEVRVVLSDPTGQAVRFLGAGYLYIYIYH